MDEAPVEKRICGRCHIEKPLTLDNFRPRTWKDKKYFEGVCRSCWRENIKLWMRKNRKRYAEKEKARYLGNKDRVAAKGAERYKRDRTRILAQREVYRQNNLQKVTEQRRLNSKNNAKVEPVTKRQIDTLFVLQKGCCAICRKKLDTWEVDHIIPLSKGGEHSIKNFQLLCRPCNIGKHADHPIDYMQKLGFLL